ncbi:uncharacterized protein LOC131017864 isoform X2 [Salvia miltiorrhiza]|uniref:uncharacterized protein LOC131017864 isoform X2 n=1 Tax=Salvia miltiorrhiza TaxID=226208 RepID=UPI0025AC2DF1|nr:uncharacterized protein LOC131017864 isoform X2 [Salvia miltiorrhiza]
MADIGVEFLVKSLKVFLGHSHLFTDTSNQIECLQKDLRLLNDSVKRRTRDQNIRDAVNEVEDEVDLFLIIKAMEKKTVGECRRWRCRRRRLMKAAQGLDSRRWWGTGWERRQANWLR